jgi:hypothetical protein
MRQPPLASSTWLSALPSLLVAVSLAAPAGASAQDIQPRVYTAAPVGINAVSVGYVYSTGEVLFDRAIPVDDVTGDVHSLTASYSRTFALFDRAARFDLAVPYVSGDWSGQFLDAPAANAKSGLADPVLRLVVPISGAPALGPAEYASFRPRTIVATTLRMGVPLGRYDPDDLVNLGSNRWWAGPQLGVSHIEGPWLVELYAGARFFSANEAFLGTSELTQSPLYTLQLHAGYRFRPGLWLAASTRQSLGGATSVDGGERVSPETNNRVGLTLNIPVRGRYSLRVAGSTGIQATIGNDYDTVVAAFTAAF